MKKLIVAAAIAMAGIAVQAATVNWSVNGVAAQENYTVYLLTSIADKYDSVDALANASVGSAVIAKSGRIYSTGSQQSTGDAVTKTATYYYAIVSGADAKTFNYVEATGLAAKVYDPAAQESSPGTFNTITAATILGGASGQIAAVPEPTSGLLMLLGVAGLALRRRRA